MRIPRVLLKVSRRCHSVALGAFLAGLSISGFHDLHDAQAQLAPLRDAFVALFFVSLGTLIDPQALAHSLSLLGLLPLLIVVGKFIVWTTVVWLFRYPLRRAITVASGLTQIGELSFVVRKALYHSDFGISDLYITERLHCTCNIPRRE